MKIKTIKHIIRTQQFNRPWLEHFFKETDKMMSLEDEGRQYLLPAILRGKRILLLFWSHSQRTKTSFNIAAQNLGATVVDVFSHGGEIDFSSEMEGAIFEDVILTFGAKSECLVIRHSQSNYAEKAAQIADRFGMKTSIINAGDHDSQHPTQALVDIYSIYKEFGRVDGLSGLFMGDCWGSRVVHSLVYLLTKFKVKSLFFVSPPRSGIPEDIIRHLNEKKIFFKELSIGDLGSVKRKVDFIYTVSLPKHLPSTKDRTQVMNAFRIDRKFVKDFLGEDGRIFHPRPRGEEIVCWQADNAASQNASPDLMPQAAYIRQMTYEDFVRMALFKTLLNPDVI